MITQRVNEALTADSARRENVGNNPSRAGGSGQGRTPAARECTFTRFMNCNLTVFHGIEGAIELRRWFEKTEMVFGISECAEGKKVKLVAATLQGPALTWWNTKVATMGLGTVNQIPWIEMKQMMTTEFCPAEEVQRMEHELWNINVKEFNIPDPTDEAVLIGHISFGAEVVAKKEGDYGKGNKMSGRNFKVRTSRSSETTRINSQNNKKQGNTRVMTTAPNEGNAPARLPLLCNRCFIRHIGPCTIQCHNYGKGHTRNHYPKKNKPQGGNASGRAYVIKDADKQGPNVIMDVSYEVELADGKVVSTNTVLKGFTLNLVNHPFKIDLMHIELGMFDVIIGMDLLAERDAIIICGEKDVRIPCENKTLIVKGDKGPSRLKVISCIKARKYIERGCQMFVA
ncbi:putative reverse transcriptase domain-containing protein [Tanacetum coccineum]